ncbi:MAG: aminotransferase class I/II-fold pyridoxal phosphate-dependent enzyme [Bacteroidota bacterium]
MAKLIKDYPNILVIRTFSKIYGLAGMRIGYALGHPDLIKELKTQYVIASAGVSSAGLAAAIASLKDTTFVKSSYQKNQQTRKYITDLFDEWDIPYQFAHQFPLLSN